MNLKTIYEDATMLVVEKPAGVDMQGLQQQLQEGFVPSHRLDKETSGLLVVAKTPEALDYFHRQFQERKVEKKYICLVVGNIKEDAGTIETTQTRALGDRRKQKASLPGTPGRNAQSEYRVLKRFNDYTLLEMKPKTGRKHQIRSQFAFLHHPLAGDKLYGFKNQPTPEGLQRHFLHASYLKVKTPSGNTKEFISELPEDLQNVLQTLEHGNEN